MKENDFRNIANEISLAREEAIRLNHDYIATEHLVLGIIRSKNKTILTIFEKLEISIDLAKKNIEVSVGFELKPHNNTKSIPLTVQSERVLLFVHLEAKTLNSDTIKPEHLLLSILIDKENRATHVLNSLGIDYEKVSNLLKNESSKENFQPQKTVKNEASFFNSLLKNITSLLKL